jgi:hypothetical protein
MDLSQIFLTQLIDPFRIALAIGLVITMMRTRAQTGTWLPLAAGIVFVAIILPTTRSVARADLAAHVGLGLFSTGLIVALCALLAHLVERNRRR